MPAPTYSAALVIHEALTGQLPYVSGKKLNDLCPKASPALQDLLDRCLKPNPEERPAGAVELICVCRNWARPAASCCYRPAPEIVIAARQTESMQPTIAYQPGKAANCCGRVASPWSSSPSGPGAWWLWLR